MKQNNHLATIEEVPPDSEEHAVMARIFEQGGRNSRWFDEHAMELNVFNLYRGKHLAVSGCELFVADTILEVLRLAREKHPGECPYWFFIPLEKVSRIYAHQR